jgi:hypothetical protein
MSDELSETGVYTTRKGVVIGLRLFSPALRDKVRQSVEFPEVPIYVAKTAGGGKEEHEYTADMIETDDERAMWAEYQGKRLAAELLLYERLGKLALIRGTEVEVPEGWEREQRFYGVKVPKDPIERKLHWIETEAVESNDDLSALILAILQHQSTTEEERAAAAASFPDSMEGVATGETESEEGAVESE